MDSLKVTPKRASKQQIVVGALAALLLGYCLWGLTAAARMASFHPALMSAYVRFAIPYALLALVFAIGFLLACSNRWRWSVPLVLLGLLGATLLGLYDQTDHARQAAIPGLFSYAFWRWWRLAF